MRRLILFFTLAVLAGCTSLMTGASGPRAGSSIGADSRDATTVARDNQISRIIRDRYAVDAGLSGAGLRVETRHGVVTIRGSLPEFDLRDRAERLARDVPGVAHVNSQITVRR